MKSINREDVWAFINGKMTLDEPWHAPRFVQSLCYLTENTKHERVLELGGEGPFTALMKKYWPDTHIQSTGGLDIRAPKFWLRWGTSKPQFDTILLMEVIEHLHDLPTEDYERRAMWTGSGQIQCLQTCYDLLEPGGTLFITTPNPCGYYPIFRAINGYAPRTYDPHVRELSKSEIISLLTKVKLVVKDHGEWNMWGHGSMTLEQIERMKKTIRAEIGDTYIERGDDLYVLAYK